MEDKEAIRQVALDYIEGWYQGNAARMDRALYAKLVKRRITPTRPSHIGDKLLES
jgi:hypothetical protein